MDTSPIGSCWREDDDHFDWMSGDPAPEAVLELLSCSCTKPGGGGALPYKRLLGMCRWMGSHFHDWTDYHGVAFVSRMGWYIF